METCTCPYSRASLELYIHTHYVIHVPYLTVLNCTSPFLNVGHCTVCTPFPGLVSRTFGIMPEKAFKMQGWIMVGRFMESNYEEPGIMKWLAAGAAAGAATTIIGKHIIIIMDSQFSIAVTCRVPIRTSHGSSSHPKASIHSCDQRNGITRALFRVYLDPHAGHVLQYGLLHITRNLCEVL